MNDESGCALCGRHVPLTFHHLIPRKMHRRNHFRRRYSRDELNRGVRLCRLCHRGLHRLYDEMTLARELSSLAALRADPLIGRHVEWVKKQKQAPGREPR